MMRVEEAKMLRLGTFEGHRTIGNPDAFVREIHLARRGFAGGFFGMRAGEKGAMEHGHLHFPGMIRYRDGKEARILVVDVDEIDAVVGAKVASPNRFQWNKSTDSARAIRGPMDESAV